MTDQQPPGFRTPDTVSRPEGLARAEVKAERAEVKADRAEVKAERAEVKAERAEVRAEARAERAEARAETLRNATARAEALRTAAVEVAAAHPPLPDPIGDPSNRVSNWNVANGLTLVRMLMVPVFAWTLFRHGGHDTGWRIIAWVVFALASITDRIDGELARRRQLITELGKLMDPIADKALIGMALVGLSMLGELPWWVTLVILVRELAVTLLRFWVIRLGVIPASRGGKAKTLAQAVAIGLYVLPLRGAWHVAAETIMGVALVLTVATGLDYVLRARAVRRRAAAACDAPSPAGSASHRAPA